MHRLLLVPIFSALLLAASTAHASAQELRIVSRIDGEMVSETLSLSDLDALGRGVVETKTSWTVGTQQFEGVEGAALARLFPEDAVSVTAIALNDYVAAIPLSDFTENRLLLATRLNGAPMRIRDNGPFWLVYRFDTLTSAQRIAAESRSVWHLATLIVE